MFSLLPLPYATGALAPHMSATTVETHYGKHHKSYVDKLNAALEGQAPKPLEAVIADARAANAKGVFNNAGQIWNHGFFWRSLTPDGPKAPSAALAAALDAAFGSRDAFKAEFVKTGVNHFASGWVWLTADASGAVKLTDSHDADTLGDRAGVTPLLVCDVWEHAYYLDFKQDRKTFLEGFADRLIDWDFASAQYAAARGEGQAWTYPSP